MKYLLILLMMFVPMGLYVTYAQEPLLIPGLPVPHIGGVHTVPDLSMKEVVDILVDYAVMHEAANAFLTDHYYGITDPKRHTIHIYDLGDRADKRDTVIHEMLHVRCNEFHIPCTEDEIEAKATEIYERLYTAN